MQPGHGTRTLKEEYKK